MIFLALVVRQFGNKKIENMFHIQRLNSNRNIQIIDTDFVSWGEKMGRNCEFHKGMICLHVEHLLGLPDPAAGRHALQVLGCLILKQHQQLMHGIINSLLFTHGIEIHSWTAPITSRKDQGLTPLKMMVSFQEQSNFHFRYSMRLCVRPYILLQPIGELLLAKQ